MKMRKKAHITNKKKNKMKKKTMKIELKQKKLTYN